MSSDEPSVPRSGAEAGRIDEALLQSGLLDELLAGLQAIVVVLDVRGRIVRCNPFFEEVSGYSQEEVVGKSWFETFVPSADVGRLARVWERALEGGDTRGTVNDIRVRDGSRRRVLWSNHVLADEGEILGVLSIGHDVTELVRASEALDRSEARMQAVIETAADGIVTIDEDGTIQTFNRAAERMFGWEADAAIGRNVRVLMPEPYHSEHDGYLRTYLETGTRRIIGIGREVVGLRRDGSVFPMHLAVSEVGHLEPRLFTGIVRDLTERKELERHLDEVAAEERHRVARDLHDDLGGTMTAVSILASILQRKLEEAGSPEAARAAELVGHVRDAHEQVRSVSRGLLPVAADPEGLMAALRGIARRTQEVHGLRCTFHCDDSVEVHDRAAANHLYRLVGEAVENAVRHARASEVRISVSADDNHVVFVIEDDGVGLPTQVESGSGMGLRTMKYRAGLLGATFAARQGAEGGTTVRCAVSVQRLSPPA